MKEKSKEVLVKNDGQVFTPTFLVQNILDFAGYEGTNILRKHIIDNSCGARAFLTEIVRRYCTVSISNGSSKEQTKTELETYIHGIELEDVVFYNCLNNLNAVVEEFEITGVKWASIRGNLYGSRVYTYKFPFSQWLYLACRRQRMICSRS